MPARRRSTTSWCWCRRPSTPVHPQARGVTAEYLAYQLWTWIHGIVDLRITHPHDAWPDAADLFADAQRLLGLCAPDS